MSRALALIFLLCALPLSAGAADLININTANAALLDTLPGIGTVKAQAIIDYRNATGTFATTQDIQNVKGIGPAIFAHIAPSITVTGGRSALPPPKAPPAKPSPTPVSSTKVQSKLSHTAYATQTVLAPAATTTTVAAAGAPVTSPSFIRTLTSPWVLGFGGVVIFSAAALLLL